MSIRHIRSASKFRQTVLIIDDQPIALSIHSAILKSLDFDLKIVCMTDPIEALEWMRNKQIDLIISDFRMHHMDGMQFIEAVNEACHNSTREIIVITAITDPKIHQSLLSAGVSACLMKPVHAEELSRISRCLLKKVSAISINNNAAVTSLC
jgi:two-component system chemotaxis response regulator CheY